MMDTAHMEMEKPKSGKSINLSTWKILLSKKTKILILFSLLVKSILSSDKFVPRVWLQGYIPLLVASSRLQMAPRWENTNLPQFDPYLVANYPRIVSGL
jgi:hypothetical protein